MILSLLLSTALIIQPVQVAPQVETLESVACMYELRAGHDNKILHSRYCDSLSVDTLSVNSSDMLVSFFSAGIGGIDFSVDKTTGSVSKVRASNGGWYPATGSCEVDPTMTKVGCMGITNDEHRLVIQAGVDTIRTFEQVHQPIHKM